MNVKEIFALLGRSFLMSVRPFCFLAFFTMLFSPNAVAQPRDWVVTMVSGRTYADVRCEKLADNILYLRRSKTDRDTLVIDSIVSVCHGQRANVVVASISGALAGGVFGGFIGAKIGEGYSEDGWAGYSGWIYGTAIGTVVGGVVAGILAAKSDDKYFDLSQMTVAEKVELLRHEVINK